MIKTGRYGEVAYDATGAAPGTPVAIVSIKNFKLSLKTAKLDVTCFQDTNAVYIPGMKDVSGSMAGFWNSDELTMFEAADAPTPGLLKLVPNTTEGTFYWSGLAYMDADIDCSVDGAPAISGSFMAAGPWAMTAGTLTARGAGERRAA